MLPITLSNNAILEINKVPGFAFLVLQLVASSSLPSWEWCELMATAYLRVTARNPPDLYFRSDVGVVNIYKSTDCLQTSNPKPVKTINNLLTKCTTSLFNSSSHLLALASQSIEKSVKLVSLLLDYN